MLAEPDTGCCPPEYWRDLAELEAIISDILRRILPPLVQKIVGGIPMGPAGPAGPAGATGPQGPAGLNVAYVGPTTPPNPLTGELWYNPPPIDTLSIWDGTQWYTATMPVPGPAGANGAPGAPGPAGASATVNVGTTTTGIAGTNAAVTNSGTTSAAVFNFTIPRGPIGLQGAAGAAGPQGPPGVISTTLQSVGTYYMLYTAGIPLSGPFAGSTWGLPGTWQPCGAVPLVQLDTGFTYYTWLVQRIS